jgi:hypoxanthine phosphoribosyltransferase
MEEMSQEVLIPRAVIQKRVQELADQLSATYAGRELIIIGVLKGAFIFVADLVRAMSIPCKVDFIRAASYGAGAETSGKIVITKDTELAISGHDVLIVEDIVDSGLTLKHLVSLFQERNPCSLKVCAFLDKSQKRKVSFEADFVGFTLDDGFVVGYGLDFDEQYRYLPDVCVIKQGKEGNT